MKARLVPPVAGLVAITLAVALATGCSGGAPMAGAASATTTTPATTPATPQSVAPVTVTIGDAPSQRVVSFEVTVTSVSLVAADGSSVSIFNGSRRVEVTHLAGTFEPLVLSAAPQGTYTQLDVTLTDPEVGFIGDNGSIKTVEEAGFTRTLTIALNPPLTISGTAAMMLNLDLNAAASLIIDPATNTVTINPVITVTSQPADEQKNQPEAGELEHLAGTVTAVDTAKGTFTISLGQSGISLTFATSTATKFEIADSSNATLGSLAPGMIVRVDGVTQADGTLLATEVESVLPVTTASDTQGLVTSITGNPVTSFTLLAQDGNGDGMSGEDGGHSMTGQVVTVNVDANTAFAEDGGNLTIDPAVFPFDAAHFSKGQNVEADSSSAPQAMGSGGSALLVTAQKVTLRQQALTGLATNLTGSLTSGQFTLTLAPDSAFALLTGQTTVTVTSQSTTDVREDTFNDDNGGDGGGDGGGADIGQVRVRGLLFFDGAQYKMLAFRVSQSED
ncbi:MAG TPA: DUF5666 domain-containing protein [Terriglobales bacterium]|nr:DUF5666 domain-containing protein [Terriglobales bacterium]